MEPITVLIPTFNRKHLLPQAIHSILLQTYPKLNIIIYDDGSTDGTETYIKTLQNSRIFYHYNPINIGVSHARNQLLDLCPTEIAAWMDSDDMSNVHRIAYQYEILKKDCCIVYTSFDCLTKETDKNFVKPPVIRKGRFANASCLFRVDKSIRFDLSLKIGEDNDWRERMNKKYKEIRMSEAFYYIRFHENRLGVTKGRK